MCRSHAGAFDLLKDRRLFHPHANVKRNTDEEDRDDERNAPAPRIVCLAAHHVLHDQNNYDREKEAERGSDLNEACVETSPFVGHVFGNVNRGAAVLPTERESLQHSDHQQDDRRGDADGGVSGKKADQRGGAAHNQEGDEKRILAPNEIADAPEEECAERAHDEADRKRRQVSDEREGVVAFRVEER